MEKSKVDLFLAQNSGKFDMLYLNDVRARLEALPDDQATAIYSVELKDPTTMLIISIFLGTLGVDRFMLGDIGLGLLKLLTGGCCYVLLIIDIINIKKKTKEYNYNKICQALAIL